MVVQFRKWCVYYHYIGDLCIWVGSGTVRRPYDERRNEQWWKLVENNNFFVDIRVAKWFDIRKDARNYEADKIRELLPVCNKLHTGWKRPPRTKVSLAKFRRTLLTRPKIKTIRWKKRISASWKNRPPISAETRVKMSEASRESQKNGGFTKGYKYSEETCAKMRASKIKYFKTHSAANKGVPRTPEEKKKIREGMKRKKV